MVVAVAITYNRHPVRSQRGTAQLHEQEVFSLNPPVVKKLSKVNGCARLFPRSPILGHRFFDTGFNSAQRLRSLAVRLITEFTVEQYDVAISPRANLISVVSSLDPTRSVARRFRGMMTFRT